MPPNRRRDTLVQWRAMTDERVPRRLRVFPLLRVVFSASKTFICLEPAAGAQRINVRTINNETTNNDTIPFAFRRNRNQGQSSVTALQVADQDLQSKQSRGLLEQNTTCWRILIVHKMW